MALCLALNASARPPAKLAPPPPPAAPPFMLLGVTLPLFPPDGVVRLTALSLAGVGGGRGFLPPAAPAAAVAPVGRFAGGAGGVGLGFVFAVAGFGALAAPFVVTAEWAEWVWVWVLGVGRGAAGAGGGGGGARVCSGSGAISSI